MRLQFWLGGAAAALAAGLILGALQHSTDRHMVTHETIVRARSVIEGCVAYRERPQSGGQYPATLDDLIRPPFGGGPFVREANVLDGRGQRLRYAVVVNEKGEAEVYAWGERAGNGRTHLCGAKAAADGTVVVFGLPE